MQNTLTFCPRCCVKCACVRAQMWWKGQSNQPRGQTRLIERPGTVICFWGHVSLWKKCLLFFCLNGRVNKSSTSPLRQPCSFNAGCQEKELETLKLSPCPTSHTHTLAPGSRMTQRVLPAESTRLSDRAVCFSEVIRDLLSPGHWDVRGQRLNQDFMLALCASNTLRVWMCVC